MSTRQAESVTQTKSDNETRDEGQTETLKQHHQSGPTFTWAGGSGAEEQTAGLHQATNGRLACAGHTLLQLQNQPLRAAGHQSAAASHHPT